MKILIGTFLHGIFAYGLISVAKRRGIRLIWISFIPIANLIMVAAISDYYRYTTMGVTSSRKKVLPVLWIIIALLYGLLYLCRFSGATVSSGPMVLFVIAVGCVIAQLIIVYKSLFDLYKSCVPQWAIWLLIANFFLVTIPITVFLVRNRDDGLIVVKK